MKFKRLRRIAKGWSSYINLAKDSKGRKIILKEVREKSPRKDLARREGEMLLKANSVGVGPKVIEVNYKKNFVAREYIKGVRFLDWAMDENFEKDVTAEELYFFIKDLYRQCLRLDSIGLSHNQLPIGKNILVEKRGGKYFPVIIDFEKATMKTPDSTRNLGQIMSFLLYNPNGAVAKKIREKLKLDL